MSAYDDAVAYLDAEVHPRCDYDIYSDMRDIVDDMQAENDKLRELIFDMLVDEERGHNDDGTFYEHVRLAKELGIEVQS